MRRTLATLATLLLFGLGACASPLSTPDTIYDLTADPGRFNGKEITVLGTYLWKPGNPDTSLLVPGVSTTDLGTDAQPIGTGIWVENFPADVSGQLHLPGDAVYGIVELTGTFETGSFGPDGAVPGRIRVTQARAIEQIEKMRVAAPAAAAGQPSLSDLLADPGRFQGKTITTRGIYFWSPGTAGLLTSAVEAEAVPPEADAQAARTGVNPQPVKPLLALDGFPPELSAQLNVGPSNSFVWGAVELTGTFETGGNWGPAGDITSHIQITDVKVLPATP